VWREVLRAEGRDVERGPVFVNREGGWLSQPTLYRRSFQPALKKAGLTPIKPYVTRHTSATLLLRAGVSLKAVSRRLGHENEAVTLKHYLHALPEDDDRAVGVLGSVFGDCPTIVPREGIFAVRLCSYKE
jgi:integrase